MKSFKRFVAEEKMMSRSEYVKYLRKMFPKWNPGKTDSEIRAWFNNKENIDKAYQIYKDQLGREPRDTEGYEKSHPLYQKTGSYRRK